MGELRHGSWPMLDILSLDLFRIVAKRCERDGGPTLVPVGLPQWLHVDSHSLVLALEKLARLVQLQSGRDALDIEASRGEGRCYVDLVWVGAPIASPVIERWSAAAMSGAPGAATLGDVLLRHGSTLWSRARDGGQESILRMPLAAPAVTPSTPGAQHELPARPEFYDFALLGSAGDAPGGALRRATFVVFDTETTGLRPSEGDEIVSIGAVRVVNGRILTGETFGRLVNPKRSIPAGSIRFHGITDAMVADAPPIEIVLPQLRSFCEGAILVAHNAAFDLKFLRLKEADAGVAFDMPVIDTLLLSAHLHPDLADHDLDAIAARIGVAIAGRHTALGDALATAAVFAGLLRLLAERGVDTLDELLEASRMAFKLRVNQASF
jgi:DNA polymerase-3 subunit epsilon